MLVKGAPGVKFPKWNHIQDKKPKILTKYGTEL